MTGEGILARLCPMAPEAAGSAPSSRAAAAAGAALVLGVSLALARRLIPGIAEQHLAFFISADGGPWGLEELVHPLFVPFLAALRGLHPGLATARFIESVQWLNALFAGLAAAMVFLIVLRATSSLLYAGLGALALESLRPFWNETLRPVDYAPAFATLAAVPCLWYLTRRRGRRFYAGLGLLSGAACAWTAACLPVVAWVLALTWREGRRGRAVLARRYIGAALAAAGASFLVWTVFHRFDWLKFNWKEAFYGVEQQRQSSLYTSRSLRRQLSLFASGQPQVLLSTAALVLVASLGSWKRIWKRHGDLLLGGALWYALFAGFFIINNAQNGFAFAGALLAPAAMAAAASLSRPAAAVLTLGAALGLGEVVLLPPADPAPPVVEGRFLMSAAGPDVFIVWAGVPSADFLFTWPLEGVRVGEAGAPDPTLWALDGRLDRRVESCLARGRTVLVADPAQTRSRVGWIRPAASDLFERTVRRYWALRAPGPWLRSPEGTAYLVLKGARRSPPPPLGAQDERTWAAALSAVRSLAPWGVSLAPRRGDSYFYLDLAEQLLLFNRPAEAGAFLAEARRLDPGLQDARADEGLALWQGGDVKAARAALRRAAASGPDDGYAGPWLRILDGGGTGTAGELAGPAAGALDAQLARGDRARLADQWARLGGFSAALGLRERAVERYREALTLRPTMGTGWLDLGSVLIAQGRRAEARWAFETASGLDADLEAREAARRWLTDARLKGVSPSPAFKPPF